MKHSFQDLKHYRGYLKLNAWRLVQLAATRYVAVTNVNSAGFEHIFTMTREIDKTARMTYGHISTQIIIKFMPGAIHKVMAVEFFS